jgi:hypothetical protein
MEMEMEVLIGDFTMVEQLRSEWRTVEKTLSDIDYDYRWVGWFGVSLRDDYAELGSALCLLFAVSIVEHALLQMREEGRFSCARSSLGELMSASRRASVPWVDLATMNEIREQRNRLAHMGLRPKEVDSRRYISIIGRQLASWGLVASDAAPVAHR